MFQKQQWIIENLTEKEPDNNVIAEIVLKKVQQYKLAGIPTIYKDLIKERVSKVYMKCLILQKIPPKRRFMDASAKTPTPFFTQKKEGLIKGLSQLFEVADDKKVPKLEVKFLEDQHSERRMAITSTIDKEASSKLQESLQIL